jgi:hypothetical protein
VEKKQQRNAVATGIEQHTAGRIKQKQTREFLSYTQQTCRPSPEESLNGVDISGSMPFN